MVETQAKHYLEQKNYYDLFSKQNNFEEVLQISHLDLLISEWPDYKNLRVIVIGSSPSAFFKPSGAFVGEQVANHPLPLSIDKIKESLNLAFYQNVNEVNEVDYDYHAKHAKQRGILFINVCFAEPNYRQDIAQFTIGFINKVLWRKYLDKQTIAVLDMRCDIHCHVSERYFRTQAYLNKDEKYRLENKYNFHRIEQIGHPTAFNVLEVIEPLKRISELNPEIACIYRKEYNCMCRENNENIFSNEH